jgi:hypothetical protein
VIWHQSEFRVVQVKAKLSWKFFLKEFQDSLTRTSKIEFCRSMIRASISREFGMVEVNRFRRGETAF